MRCMQTGNTPELSCLAKKSVDPDESAPVGAVSSGSTHFTI